MPTGHHLNAEEKLSVLEDLMGAQDSHQGIAANHKLSLGTVTKLARLLAKRKNGTSLKELAGIGAEPSKPPKAKSTQGHKGKTKYAGLHKRMDRLKESGWSVKEIAEHLKIPKSAVNYYLYSSKPNQRAARSAKRAAKAVRKAPQLIPAKTTSDAVAVSWVENLQALEAEIARIEKYHDKLIAFRTDLRHFLGLKS